MDDIKAITLRRVQAIRDAEAAAKEQEAREREAEKLRQFEVFKPLSDIWLSLQDLNSRHFQGGVYKPIPLWAHAGCSRIERGSICRLSLYSSTGNTGLTFSAMINKEGHCYIERSYNNSGWKEVTTAEAEDELLKYIARYLITDDEQPK